MDRGDYIFTSESVSEGHPDKICDAISDAVVDTYIGLGEKPEDVRVACETLVTTNKVVIAGEVRGNGESKNISKDKIIKVARDVIKEIGYELDTFHWDKVDVSVFLHQQSDDISRGVDADGNKEEGAGDQGIMFGYACNETKALMPAPIQLSHEILLRLRNIRKSDLITGLGPDAKSQVTLEYKEGKPVRAKSIVVSTQHERGLSPEDVKELIRPYVIETLPEGWMCSDKEFYVNPTGNFEIGGPHGDAGLTGRKIIVDTYGGACPHGGGAFSGKDPSKVDRSAAYAARYIAKNIVAAKLAEKCTIQLSYAIGISHPLSIYVNTHSTGNFEDRKIEEVIPQVFDLTPKGIREMLDLARPIYKITSAYGHFGRESNKNGSFSWEKTDKEKELKKAFG